MKSAVHPSDAPDYVETYTGLSSTFAQRCKPDLALNSYNGAIEADYDYDFANFCVAATNADLGKYARARADYWKALAANNNGQLKGQIETS